jgi:hypothetical protein
MSSLFDNTEKKILPAVLVIAMGLKFSGSEVFSDFAINVMTADDQFLGIHFFLQIIVTIL